MKAEQRKELETNALADRMGTFVQRMKSQERRTTIYWVLGSLVLVVVLFLVMRWFYKSRSDSAARWVGFELGATSSFRLRPDADTPGLQQLIQDAPETQQGKAARFQIAWFYCWERGIKRLGIDGFDAMKALNTASTLYQELKKDCADDPVLESEAMYGLAVIEETRAVQDDKHLKSAKELYEELATKHGKTARGKLANQWVENYNDERKRQDLEQFYTEMRTSLRIPDPIAPKKGADFKKAKSDGK